MQEKTTQRVFFAKCNEKTTHRTQQRSYRKIRRGQAKKQKDKNESQEMQKLNQRVWKEDRA